MSTPTKTKPSAAGLTKTLTRHGNSLALVIDKPILDMLHIDADTPLTITTDGNCIVVAPAHHPKRRKQFTAALEKVNEQWGDVLKRLAKQGTAVAIVFLTLDEVIEIHHDQIQRYGGDATLRDLGLLQSAVATPQSGFAGRHLHAHPHEMAAAYLFHLAQNHPFVDGNKRTALASALTFLELNGLKLIATQDAVEQLTVSVASGETPKATVADFFRTRIAS